MKKLIFAFLLVAARSTFAMDQGLEQKDETLLINYVPQVEHIVMRLTSLTSRECQEDRKAVITSRLDSMVKTIAGTSIAWRTLNAYQDGLVFARQMNREAIMQSLQEVKNRAESSKNYLAESVDKTDSKTDKDHIEGALLARRSQLLDEMGAQLALHLIQIEELNAQIAQLKS